LFNKGFGEFKGKPLLNLYLSFYLAHNFILVFWSS